MLEDGDASQGSPSDCESVYQEDRELYAALEELLDPQQPIPTPAAPAAPAAPVPKKEQKSPDDRTRKVKGYHGPRGAAQHHAETWGPFTLRKTRCFGSTGWLGFCPYHRGSTKGTKQCSKFFPDGSDDTGYAKVKQWLMLCDAVDRRRTHKVVELKAVSDLEFEALEAMALTLAPPPPGSVLADDILDATEEDGDGAGDDEESKLGKAAKGEELEPPGGAAASAPKAEAAEPKAAPKGKAASKGAKAASKSKAAPKSKAPAKAAPKKASKKERKPTTTVIPRYSHQVRVRARRVRQIDAVLQSFDHVARI